MLQLTLYLPAGAHVIPVIQFYTVGLALSCEYQIVIQIPKPNQEHSLAFWLNAQAQLKITRSFDQSPNPEISTLTGIVREIEQADSGTATKIVLHSLLAPLNDHVHERSLENPNFRQLVKSVMEHYPSLTYELDENPKGCFTKPYLQQTLETDFAFLTKNLARLGVFYYVNHEERKIVFIDHENSLKRKHKEVVLKCAPFSGGPIPAHHIYHIAEQSALLLDQVTTWSYQLDWPAEYNRLQHSSKAYSSEHFSDAIPALGEKNIYTDYYRDHEEGERRAAYHRQALDWQRHVICAYSDCVALRPGQQLRMRNQVWTVVAIDLQACDRRSRFLTRISKKLETVIDIFSRQDSVISHFLPDHPWQPVVLPTAMATSSAFLSASTHARLWLIPTSTPYCQPMEEYQPGSQPFRAGVISQVCDEKGRYRVKSNSILTAPIPMMQPYNARDEAGFAFVQPSGAPICIGYLYDNPEQPIILGALPNQDHPGPVTADNATQHVVRTESGLECVIDTDPTQETIQLSTKNQAQSFFCESTSGKEHIALKNLNGDIEIVAKTTLTFHSQADQHVTVKGDYHADVPGQCAITAESGDMEISAAKTFYLSAKTGLETVADQGSIAIDATERILLHANHSIEVRAHQENIRIDVNGASFTVVGNVLHLSSDGTITLQQGAGQIQISSQGQIRLTAPKINMRGENIKLNGMK